MTEIESLTAQLIASNARERVLREAAKKFLKAAVTIAVDGQCDCEDGAAEDAHILNALAVAMTAALDFESAADVAAKVVEALRLLGAKP